LSGCLPVQKKRFPKKIDWTPDSLRENQLSSPDFFSHADFDKKKYEKKQNALEISKEKNGFTLDHFFSFVKLIMVEWCSKDGLVNIQIKFPLLMLLLPLLVDFTKKIAPLYKI